MDQPARIIRCPRCGKSTSWEAEPRGPFCSERCRLIDLGRWANGDYSIPADEQDDRPEDERLGED